jgi:hypothetical protein
VLALGHPEVPAQDEVVLLAGVRVQSDTPAGAGRGDLEDRDVARRPTIDMRHPAQLGLADRALVGPDHERRREVVDEEPGGRHLQRVGDRHEAAERGRGLVVLDLRQVAHVQAAALGDVGERQLALRPPALDLHAHGGLPPGLRRRHFALHNIMLTTAYSAA